MKDAQKIAELICLPFIHHHEKHYQLKKTPSGNSLPKLNMSSSNELHSIKGKSFEKIYSISYCNNYRNKLNNFSR